MIINLPKRPENLEKELARLAPWGHYFKFDDQTITGFFTKITSPENAVSMPETTFCTKCDELEKIRKFNEAYKEMITDSKRQFMLIDILKKLMGSDFHNSTAYDFGCNDGMKTFYFKSAGVKKAVGFEYREDCIKRAEYINSIAGFNCEFQHYPVSAESPEYVTDMQPAEIVASFGILHHLVDHKMHLQRLSSITKNVLVLHSAFTGEGDKNKVIREENSENSFKSITGIRALTTKAEIVDLVYQAGFSYVLEILDHKFVDAKGFDRFMSYLIAVK